jgi:hypothetical protein
VASGGWLQVRSIRAGPRSWWAPVLIAGLLAGAGSSRAQHPSPAPPLEFLGFRPGVTVAQVDSQLVRAAGDPLRCQRSTVDRSVSECRASLADAGGRPVKLWLSAMDGRVGVLTLSGAVTAQQLADWRSELEGSYGPSEMRVQGVQRMLQWIQSRHMLRLTWREDPDSTVASVSLVDGKILDAWGKRARPGGIQPPGAQRAPTGDSSGSAR